jgi:tetratricopeptide (TPR) repeat protein
VIAALRTGRLGPSAAALAAGSLTAGAYWLVHASYDWFWHYPAITAPVMFLFGAAAAPPLLDRAANTVRSRGRWAGVAVLAVALLMAIPLFLSQRYANGAYDEARSDPGAAISDLNHAADLDPYDPEPLLAKGVIESRLGRDAAGVSALRQAIGRQPDGYAGHFFLARVLARTDLTAARAEAGEALRLNPLDPQTRALARSLIRARAQR